VGSQKVDKILGDRALCGNMTGSEGAGIEVGIGAAKRIKKVVLEWEEATPLL